MTANVGDAVRALNQEYLRRYPEEASSAAGWLQEEELMEFLTAYPSEVATRVWERLPHDRAERLVGRMEEAVVQRMFAGADPVRAARVLARIRERERSRVLALLAPAKARELQELLSYPEGSAGAMMDPRFLALQRDMSARAALLRVRRERPRLTRQLFVVDDDGRLQHIIELSELALAEPGERLEVLARPVQAVVLTTASRDEVLEKLEAHRIADLPVVDIQGRLCGVIRYDALMDAVRAETSADILTMVGASKDERALSGVGFVVRKRLPWLLINLVTAFVAASVVGLFEGTIARFTALAVLLPVVAGQSGNTGAQALAVTMRGLALREIGTSQWYRVARKEVGAGLLNGVAIAVTTGIGVLVWSGSHGLAAVIASAMVLSMVAAGLSGVVIPIVLTRVGQDPAQSSSIILTTVTDVVGFFSFLGIATLLAFAL